MSDIYGAIIGDVAGSFLEVLEIEDKKNKIINLERRKSILSQDYELFSNMSSFTDDSILTCAVANAILTDGDYSKSIKEFGEKEKNLGVDIYGRSKFGDGFIRWLTGGDSHSWGNGCAMRISPVGYAFDTLEETLIQAEKSIVCTHDHNDTIASGKAVAGAIYLARTGADKEKIESFVRGYIPNLDFNLEELQETYNFKVKAINSVPQAIACFLNGNDFEDVLRKSISIGGDSDTIASIACGIAGAYYDIPEDIKASANKYITDEYRKILDDFNERFVGRRNEYAEENNSIR
jgi:ADP-ribosylglycohydrolase